METKAGQAVLERLARLEVAQGISHDRMVLFPVFGGGNGSATLEYRVLGEAIADGSVEVKEQPSASVPELVLVNHGKTMVFVMDGEEIVGGRQNRIVNASFLVAPASKVVLPVSCVEHGRWHSTSASFDTGEAMAFRMKELKHARVAQSLRTTGKHIANQGEIWDDIARRQAAAKVCSETGAMNDIYRERGESLASYERAFTYPAGAVGMAVALNGRMAGADIFDQPRTASALWPKLVRSYAMDALEGPRGDPVDHSRAVRLLARADGAQCEVFPSLALGEDVRFVGDGVTGAALVYAATPVHTSLFRVHSNSGREAGETLIARSSTRGWFHGRRRGAESERQED